MSCCCSMENDQNPEEAAGRELHHAANTLMLARLIEGKTLKHTLLGDPLANTFLDLRALALADFDRNDGRVNVVKAKEDLLQVREEGDDILQELPEGLFRQFYNGAQFADYYEGDLRHRHLSGVDLKPILHFRGDIEDIFPTLRIFGLSEKYAAGAAGWMASDPDRRCCDRAAVTACPWPLCRVGVDMPKPEMPGLPGLPIPR